MRVKLGLRVKTLLLSFLPIFIMLLIALVIWYITSIQMNKSIVCQRDTEIARITALRLSEQLEKHSQALRDLSQSEPLQQLNSIQTNNFIKKSGDLMNQFDEGLAVIDKNGNIVFSSSQLSDTKLNKHVIDYILKTVSENLSIFYSNIYFDNNTNKDYIIVSAPIVSIQGELLGIINGYSSIKYSILQSIYNKTLEIDLDKKNFAFLVDGNGYVIFHRHSKQIGKNLSNMQAVENVLQKTSGAVSNVDELKNNIINGYAPVPNTDWGVITQENWSATIKPLRQYTIVIISLIICGFIFSGITVYLGMGFILVKPVINLANNTKLIAETNDYSKKPIYECNDEIGSLYEDFNKMIEAINNHDIALLNNGIFLYNIINSIPLILICTDRNGKILKWNKSAVMFSNIDEADAIGAKIYDLIPDLIKFNQFINFPLSSNRSLNFFRQSIGKDPERTYNITFSPFTLYNDDGMIIIIDDISDLEKKDFELRQMQKMESIGILAGSLAHDFNNILMGITGSLSILQYHIDNNKTISMENLTKSLSTIKLSSDRATELVKQLMTLSRKQESHFKPTDLNVAIENMTAICKNTFDKKIEFQINCSESPAIVNGDQTQLEQVILNIFINACHSMTIMRPPDVEQTGILSADIVMIMPEQLFRLSHPEAVQEYYWLISIKDNGVGIDKNNLDKIFDPFFTTKNKGQGIGLGLSVAYNIIKMHQGFIEVNSQVGFGTTFNIYLPLLQDINSEPETKEKRTILKGTGTILVVDDEEIVRNIASSILIECGYNVVLANDGIDATKIYKEKKDLIDGILLDYVMPHANGKETFLKLLEINPEVKVILTSGFNLNEKIIEMENLGIKNFLQKPFTIESLSISVFNTLNSEREQ